MNVKEKVTSRKFWFGCALVIVGLIVCATGYVSEGLGIVCLGACGYMGVEAVCDIARYIVNAIADRKKTVTVEFTAETDDDAAEDDAEEDEDNETAEA